jgi:hypothetical protein
VLPIGAIIADRWRHSARRRRLEHHPASTNSRHQHRSRARQPGITLADLIERSRTQAAYLPASADVHGCIGRGTIAHEAPPGPPPSSAAAPT